MIKIFLGEEPSLDDHEGSSFIFTIAIGAGVTGMGLKETSLIKPPIYKCGEPYHK